METGQATTFGEALRRHRLAAGLTQEELAERAGLSVRGLSYLEKDGRQPYRDTVRRLGEALRLEPDARLTLDQAAREAPTVPEAAGQPTEPEMAAGDRLHNLPLSLSSFVGREREMAQVAELLGGSRLLTLTGAGGVGKTRLALQVAAATVERYPHGVWLVELAPLGDPALVPQAIAAALQVREEPGRPVLASLTEALRSRHLLLVLDNCEHLVGACAELAEVLLRACPALQILATSREALGIGGETAWQVPSLGLPDPQHLPPPETLADCEAVRLFAERARAVQPAFALGERNAEAVAQLCVRLDGIPLALELAAACLRGLTVEQVAARLDRRFRLLTGGSRTALPRQQTLRATVEWSYSLLSPSEQRLFDRLSVFAGGWTLEAAEAVCADGELAEEDVLDLLLRLVGKSLVQTEEGIDGETRYHLLETLRQYAGERLAESADAAAAQQRHAHYFLAVAEAAEPHLKGRDQVVWMARLDAARDDLRTAWRWYVDHGVAEEAVRLAVALQWFWYRRGVMEARTWFTHLVTLPELAAPGVVRAQALAWAGMWLGAFGDLAEGGRLLEEALTWSRPARHAAITALTLHFLGLNRLHVGATDEGRCMQEEALALYRGLGDQWSSGEMLCHLGALAYSQGDLMRATELAAEALSIARATGDIRRRAWAVEVLGQVSSARGDVAEATVLLEEGRAAYHEVGDLRGMAAVEEQLGHLALRQKSYAVGRQRFVASLQHLHALGIEVRGLSALIGLASVASIEGDTARALRLAAASAFLHNAHGLAIPATDQAVIERIASETRSTLGVNAVADIWAEGQAMTLEQAIAYALETSTPGP
jgi:non-specific serine/threonine protein kinase